MSAEYYNTRYCSNVCGIVIKKEALGPDYMRRAGPIKRAGPSTRDGFLFAIT